VIDDWAALGVLEEAAVSRGHTTAHDAVAALAGTETAAVYRLAEGSPDPGCAAVAVWVTPAGGHDRPVLARLLGDGIDPSCDGLWERCLVLGSAPRYCVLAGETPAGASATRLPSGWSAATVERAPLWRG